MSYLTHLECSQCGKKVAADQPQNNTCTDGGILDPRYDLDRIRLEVSREDIARGPSTLWRYAPLLPAERPAEAVTLGEGWTPLLNVPRLARELGCPNLYVKDEGRNPSGTFKDRGATVAVTRLKELGVKKVVHNSSGNAGGSWALYTARAGIECVNLFADDAMPAVLQQSSLAGAMTLSVEAPWKESGAMVALAAEHHGWFNCATLKEPYRLDGKKTMGYEICEQLGWRLPDVVIYPTGGAVGPIAIQKAFNELIELGWVENDRKPRFIVVQYEGCSPIVKAFHEGNEETEVWQDLDVLPGGLKSTAPPGGREVLRILRDTGGTAITVGNQESLDEVARMVRMEGLFPCPEGAITLAALRKALAAGSVDRDETVVLMSTGSGLKSISVMPEPDVRGVRTMDDIRNLTKGA
jgi:threonine synthase